MAPSSPLATPLPDNGCRSNDIKDVLTSIGQDLLNQVSSRGNHVETPSEHYSDDCDSDDSSNQPEVN